MIECPSEHTRKFLRTYNDENLAKLLIAAEAGKVAYHLQSRCLLGRHQLGYVGAQRLVPSAFKAELEYRYAGYDIQSGDWGGDEARHRWLLPLVRAEAARRVPVTVEEPVLA